MAIADMIPTLNDAALGVLRENTSRLEAGADGPRQKQAVLLMPLIEAELAERLSKKPAKPVRAVRRKPVAKAVKAD